MLNIAITGSFSSGKSFVLRCVKNLGYKVFSCDDYVKEIYHNVDFQNEIVAKMDGLDFFDKKELAKIIYNDHEAKQNLEKIIHPMVRLGIKEFEKLNELQKLIFTEVPLLFESNFDKYFAYSICVFCNEETRLERAKERGITSLALYNKIKLAQLSQEEKKQKSDFIIDSENDKKEIEKSLINIIKQIK